MITIIRAVTANAEKTIQDVSLQVLDGSKGSTRQPSEVPRSMIVPSFFTVWTVAV
jgi:hypothetical protein